MSFAEETMGGDKAHNGRRQTRQREKQKRTDLGTYCVVAWRHLHGPCAPSRWQDGLWLDRQQAAPLLHSISPPHPRG